MRSSIESGDVCVTLTPGLSRLGVSPLVLLFCRTERGIKEVVVDFDPLDIGGDGSPARRRGLEDGRFDFVIGVLDPSSDFTVNVD